MLTLTNIGKIYATRRKRNIYGLKDVNLSFPDKGFCLILGKSGGGKTTLLNILGGLDVKYEGDYEFMGKKLEQKDFPELRQNHISFVFQDFNLIDDYTVAENVALGIQLAQDSDGNVSEVLSKVGLEGYDNRFPQELSGGQQQRVAIARSLLKQSSMILADEPTGNLDGENSEEIYKLLKEISRDKLVVVVSHDEELGLQYADYVVRLNKGKVTESNLPGVADNKQYVARKQHVVSNKQAFKMGAREITRSKVKSALTITLMAICFCVLSFTVLAVPLFKMSDVHYRLIKDMDYPYFNLTDVTLDEYRQLQSSGVETIVGSKDYLLMDKQQAESIGFEFYDGALPLTPNSYYVSDLSLLELTIPNMFGQTNNRAIIDGKEVLFSEYQIPNLVGAKIHAYGYDKTCAGIFKHGSGLYDNDLTRFYNAIKDATIRNVVAEYTNGFVSNLSAEYDGKRVDISGVIEVGEERMWSQYAYVLTRDGIAEYNRDDDVSLKSLLHGNEVFVEVEMFNSIFQLQHTVDTLIDAQLADGVTVFENKITSKRIPAELGKTISIVLPNGERVDNLIVKGIVFSRFNTTFESGNGICLSGDRLDDGNLLKMATREFDVWVKTDSVTNLKSFLAQRNGGFIGRCRIYSPVTQYTSEIANSFDTPRMVLLGMSVVLTIATIIMTNLLISGQIVGQKRKIGIYKALGAKNGDIIKIYLYEMLLITVPMIILTIAATAIVTTVLNVVFVEDINPALTLIYYQWSNVPITIVSVFAILFVGIITPLRKITKLNVIEAIKGTANK